MTSTGRGTPTIAQSLVASRGVSPGHHTGHVAGAGHSVCPGGHCRMFWCPAGCRLAPVATCRGRGQAPRRTPTGSNVSTSTELWSGPSMQLGMSTVLLGAPQPLVQGNPEYPPHCSAQEQRPGRALPRLLVRALPCPVRQSFQQTLPISSSVGSHPCSVGSRALLCPLPHVLLPCAAL